MGSKGAALAARLGSAHEHKSGKPQTEYKVAAAFNSLNTLQFHLKASLFEGKRSHMLALLLGILLAFGAMWLSAIRHLSPPMTPRPSEVRLWGPFCVWS